MLLSSTSRAHVLQKSFSTLKLRAIRFSLRSANSNLLQPLHESRFHMYHPFPSMSILLAKVRDTHRDHLCNYSSGVLWAQILPFKLPVLSISFSMEARKEMQGTTQEFAVWRKWKVLEKQHSWLWEITQITQTAEGSKKKTVTADKEMNKKMDKEVRRNTV